MIIDETIVEINGKKYHLDEGYNDSGSSYSEVEKKYWKLDPEESYWDTVDNAFALCGKCQGDTFKVSACSSNYESWAYCPCGNKFLLHTG